jgi:hypothetical protein
VEAQGFVVPVGLGSSVRDATSARVSGAGWNSTISMMSTCQCWRSTLVDSSWHATCTCPRRSNRWAARNAALISARVASRPRWPTTARTPTALWSASASMRTSCHRPSASPMDAILDEVPKVEGLGFWGLPLGLRAPTMSPRRHTQPTADQTNWNRSPMRSAASRDCAPPECEHDQRLSCADRRAAVRQVLANLTDESWPGMTEPVLETRSPRAGELSRTPLPTDHPQRGVGTPALGRTGPGRVAGPVRLPTGGTLSPMLGGRPQLIASHLVCALAHEAIRVVEVQQATAQRTLLLPAPQLRVTRAAGRRLKARPRPIMAMPRTRCRMSSARFTGTKLAVDSCPTSRPYRKSTR